MKAICDFCKRKAKYECPDCATKFCQKHAEEFDYECSACPPPELVEIRLDSKKRKVVSKTK